MKRSSLFLTIASAVWFCQPNFAQAGMPSVTLNEITSLRLQNIRLCRRHGAMVRFLTNEVSPEVLKAMSTPNGGEAIHEGK